VETIPAYRLYAAPEGNQDARGAAFISLPMEIMAADATGDVLTPVKLDLLGAADEHLINAAPPRRAHRSLGAE
jgi:hypothetical protein